MRIDPDGRPDNGRARKIFEALEAHPAGLSAPQLLTMIDVPAATDQLALTKIGNVLRYQAKKGHLRYAGEVPGAWQRGPASIFALTGAGYAWLELVKAGRQVRRQQAESAVNPEVDAAISRVAAAGARTARVRAAIREDLWSLRPGTLSSRQRSALIAALREARFTLDEIAAIIGITREGVRHNLARQGKGDGMKLGGMTWRGRTPSPPA